MKILRRNKTRNPIGRVLSKHAGRLLLVLSLHGCALVTAKATTAFKHQTEAANTRTHWTSLSNSSTNGKPANILIVTPDFGLLGPYHPHSVGVWYASGEWRIFNQGRSAMGMNAKFNVLSVEPGERAFVHSANRANTFAHLTAIDHPLLNGNPDARLLVTQRWNGSYNDHPIGVYYLAGKWQIYNQDNAAMPLGAAFNVVINNHAIDVSSAERTGNWTAIDHLSTNDKQDAFVFATQRFSGGANPHQIGVWYASGSWRVINQDRAPMPGNTAFNVLSVDAEGRTPTDEPLWGFVDMHTHPCSQFGFGEELFFGGNDGNPAHVLGDCSCAHGSTDNCFDITPGRGANILRNAVVMNVEDHAPSAGYPDFRHWPTHRSRLHQQMWFDWIRRARDGGLRVIVALTVSSHAIADGGETNGPNDDLRTMNRQIKEIKALVGRHPSFMEMAYSTRDLKRIVRAGRLAVILGVEMDNIGNFYDPVDHKGGVYNPNPTDDEIRDEIDRLYSEGVRYIFPVHLTNNLFGGAALAERELNVANKYNTGKAFEVEAVLTEETGISHLLESPYTPFPIEGEFLMNFTGTVLPPHIMPNNRSNYPNYEDSRPGIGHRNVRGLTRQGRVAVEHMMKKGMMIDVDHMSERTLHPVLAMAEEKGYPMNSGHNSLRKGDHAGENSRTVEVLSRIQRLGGMFGLGHADRAGAYVENFREAREIMGNHQLAFGTDVNGFVELPGPPPVSERVQYGSASGLARYRMGNKTWDFNTDGFAHYGLFPEFVESMRVAGMTDAEEETLFSGAEGFCRMWSICENRAYSFAGSPIGETTTPSPIGPFCPNDLVSGDREFGGGPQLTTNVELQITADRTRIEAIVTFSATERGGANPTKVQGLWREPVYTAPAGAVITAIRSPRESNSDFVGRGAGIELGGCSDGDVLTAPLTGGLVKFLRIIGDTGGDDVSDDDDCSCDTQIRSIEFHPISVALQPANTQHAPVTEPVDTDLSLTITKLNGTNSAILRLSGVADKNYRLESSTNLRNWNTVTNSLRAFSPHRITLSNEPQYYRARSLD